METIDIDRDIYVIKLSIFEKHDNLIYKVNSIKLLYNYNYNNV